MRAAGVPLAHIKESDQWASDCVYEYIKPMTGEKFKWDKLFALR